MIVKAKSPPVEDLKSFHLSFLDQNAVRVYTQTLCIFPFRDQNNAEAAIAALDDGLRLTLQKLPFLAGMLSLADDGSGKLQLQYYTDGTDCEVTKGLFAAKQILVDDFSHSYEVLNRMACHRARSRVPHSFQTTSRTFPACPPTVKVYATLNEAKLR